MCVNLPNPTEVVELTSNTTPTRVSYDVSSEVTSYFVKMNQTCSCLKGQAMLCINAIVFVDSWFGGKFQHHDDSVSRGSFRIRNLNYSRRREEELVDSILLLSERVIIFRRNLFVFSDSSSVFGIDLTYSAVQWWKSETLTSQEKEKRYLKCDTTRTCVNNDGNPSDAIIIAGKPRTRRDCVRNQRILKRVTFSI